MKHKTLLQAVQDDPALLRTVIMRRTSPGVLRSTRSLIQYGEMFMQFAAQEWVAMGGSLRFDAFNVYAAQFSRYADHLSREDFRNSDECPHCHSRNTERMETISDDPEIWIATCGRCGENFEV